MSNAADRSNKVRTETLPPSEATRRSFSTQCNDNIIIIVHKRFYYCFVLTMIKMVLVLVVIMMMMMMICICSFEEKALRCSQGFQGCI